jgi:cyclohexadieny/prephenate dehydrogenase
VPNAYTLIPHASPLMFPKLTLIGIGLIGSSLARALKEQGVARTITIGDINPDHCAKALELGLAQYATTDLASAVEDADCVIICTPVSTYSSIVKTIAPHLKAGCILTDVGSVKQQVIDAVLPHVPAGVAFVPAHPIAGTEHSGPTAGFAALFKNRWCILTPLENTPPAATATIKKLWEAMGSNVEIMTAAHHDKVLAITSHLPHLIAYTIVGTATELETSLQAEVIKFSASGFRDFTRIAASDPIMWRDIFLNNREAVLDILGRFTEDLTALQKAIRHGDGDTLQQWFTHTRAIRKGIVEAEREG